MADPLERLTNLLALLLETREPLTQDRIAAELAHQYPADLVARRGAFERDKAMLRAEGIPIETVTTADGGTAYRIDRRRYELADLGLMADETRALQVAVATVHLGTTWGEDALLKLDADGATATGTAAALGSLDALPILFQANVERAAVAFDYRGTTRNLDPYGLVSRDGFWYVVGRDHARNELRTFRVDRIDGAIDIGEPGSFTPPVGFLPADALLSDPKAFGDSTAEAIVLVDAGHAARLLRELGESAVRERRDDGSIVFAVPCANRWAFRSWLLGFMEHAEVLAPQDVRAEIVDWLQAIVDAGSVRR